MAKNKTAEAQAETIEPKQQVKKTGTKSAVKVELRKLSKLNLLKK